MPDTQSYAFFLGANSPSGFFSLYDDLIDLKTANAVYLIKGGPGCGKSSFMRRAAEPLIAGGCTAEYIFCSSDPTSLDGIVFPELAVAFVDATAPHVVEPRYPYITEQYINLGVYYDTAALAPLRERAIDAFDGYRSHYAGAYRCIKAAKSISDDIFNIALSGASIEKLHKRARGIISREIRGKGRGAALKRRFLSSISPDGLVWKEETVGALSRRVFEIDDPFGLSHFLLSPILEAALTARYTVYACYCPLNPEKLEHLFIPELSLSFISTDAT
ncbi:hypothetical protein LJC32_07015, partial [Oscillospiraceae bacterium OttesenSCG-928-F05]|nr:hypothetical protein [Oscillospiraceae bacterium OttesenSCG-928-F05]